MILNKIFFIFLVNDITHFNTSVSELGISEFIKKLDFFIYHSNNNISDDVSEFVFKDLLTTTAVENEDEQHLLKGRTLSSIFEIQVRNIEPSQDNLFRLVKLNNRIELGDFLKQNITAIRILEADLTKYNISNNQLEIFHSQLIQPGMNLKELNLSSNKIHTIGTLQFTNLTELNLNNNRLEMLSLDLSHLKLLTDLSVIDNILKTVEFKNPRDGTLKNLYLQNNKIEDTTLTEQIINLTQLRKLHLQDNFLKEVESIKRVIKLPSLQEFYVYNNDFSDESAN